MNPLSTRSSWLGITLNEVENQLKRSGSKPLGSMSVDEVLENLWMSSESSSSRHHVSSDLSISPAVARKKTVDEVWRDIRRGCRRRNLEAPPSSSLGETTLEDFLVQAGMYASSDHAKSVETASDAPEDGRKRGLWDYDKTVERRLRRKIKNRESAARSRARKQAYHNDLLTKVSILEEENTKLKKEKEFDEEGAAEKWLPEPRYQLRRTTSF